jgi:cytochrome b
MSDTEHHRNGGKRTAKVWDIWVRVFHWVLVIAILMSYLTGEVGGFDFTMPGTDRFVSNMNVHVWSGLTILGLIVFRIIWGFAGSSTALFKNFTAGPSVIINYVKSVLSGPTKFFAGHNPAGGAVVMIILLALAVQASTGLFAKDESFFATSGPLAFLVSEETSTEITSFHKLWWEYAVLILIVLHIAANLFYWLVKKQDLIWAMITGRRKLPDGVQDPGVAFAPVWLGILIALIAGVVIFLVSSAESL